MVNKEKFRTRLLREPTPKDITWAELRSYLLSLGFEEAQSSGSRVWFYLQAGSGERGMMIRLHRPHPEKVCGPLMIRDVAQTLKAWGLV
ncbi:type II toxin-antitoxin system HicA family toxin [Marinobacter nauticus]|uniref:type II toxin-antitoxin system HicA family toxin n=1 Tax=Marinobacter nauticus TaxID=2743 RepID=UPI0039A67DB9